MAPMRFVSQITLPPASPRLAQPAAGRPRVFLRQAQDKLTSRRTENVRLRSSPAVPRDGCPVARPSPRSCGGVPCIASRYGAASSARACVAAKRAAA